MSKTKTVEFSKMDPGAKLRSKNNPEKKYEFVSFNPTTNAITAWRLETNGDRIGQLPNIFSEKTLPAFELEPINVGEEVVMKKRVPKSHDDRKAELALFVAAVMDLKDGLAIVVDGCEEIAQKSEALRNDTTVVDVLCIRRIQGTEHLFLDKETGEEIHREPIDSTL